jgi:hypothetical protein
MLRRDECIADPEWAGEPRPYNIARVACGAHTIARVAGGRR